MHHDMSREFSDMGGSGEQILLLSCDISDVDPWQWGADIADISGIGLWQTDNAEISQKNIHVRCWSMATNS